MPSDVFLITGATSGVGLSLTEQLAKRDHKVVAIGRNKKKLAEISGEGTNVTGIAFDVSNLSEITDFIADVFDQHPNINVVINNAGIQDNVRMDDPNYSIENIKKEIAVNLTAPIEISRAALGFLERNDAAAIVNITSGLALVPKLTSAVYSATKSGLQLFSDGLRVQTKGKIDVIEVILPVVDTPMTEGRGSGKISANEAAKQIMNGIEKRSPKIYVGKAKFLPILMKFAPSIARRVIQKS